MAENFLFLVFTDIFMSGRVPQNPWLVEPGTGCFHGQAGSLNPMTFFGQRDHHGGQGKLKAWSCPGTQLGYVGVHDLWQGYKGYTRVAVPLNDTCARSAQKKVYLDQMSKAACFWRAAAFSAPEAKGKLTEAVWDSYVRWEEGMNVAMAVEWARKWKLRSHISIFVHDPVNGDVDRVYGTGEQGVMHVLYDDNAEQRPHWLPILKCKKGKVYVTESTFLPEDPEPVVGNAQQGAAVVVKEQVVLKVHHCPRLVYGQRIGFPQWFGGHGSDPAAVALAVAEVEELVGKTVFVKKCADWRLKQQVDLSHELPFFNGMPSDTFHPLTPVEFPFEDMSHELPFYNGDASDVVHPLTPVEEVQVVEEIADVAVPDMGVRGLLDGVMLITSPTPPPLCPGAAWRGAMAGIGCQQEQGELGCEGTVRIALLCCGGSDFELYRLGPELKGQVLREGVRVFTERTRPHVMHPQLDSTGCYRMECVTGILCEHGELLLTERSQFVQDGRFFEVATLKRRKVAIYRRRWWFGFTGSVCKDVLMEDMSPVLSMECFSLLPTGSAKVRAAAAVVRPLLDDEIVGPFNDAKLEVLGLKEPDTVNILEVAKQLNTAGRVAKRLAGSQMAFGH